MRVLFSILSIVLLISSCKNSAHNESDDFAYIGGEIINPTENTIILESKNKTIDTIKLDGRNRFFYKIDNFYPGIYTFRHGSEYQMIMLEPNDSYYLG